MRNLSKVILYLADASTTVSSDAIDCSQIYATSLQAKFSDVSLAGTFKLQASNDLNTPINWSDVATASVATGALTLIPMTQLSYQWIRATFVPSAGTGTINVNINSQGF